jgi:RNA polymerase sigma-70 factor (ECF subfamily)
MTNLNPAEFVSACRSGNPQAIETLVAEHSPALLRLAGLILGDPVEAEDAVQEAFIAALSALDGYRGDSSLRTWLTSITVNICRSRLRKSKARRKLMAVLGGLLHLKPASAASSEKIAAENVDRRVLWQAIQGLDEDHRLPVILRYYLDLPAYEIARMLGIPAGTVHSRLFTARQRLRQVLETDRSSIEGERCHD